MFWTAYIHEEHRADTKQEQASVQIADLHRQIDQKDQEHEQKIDGVKDLIRAQFKKQAEKQLGYEYIK